MDRSRHRWCLPVAGRIARPRNYPGRQPIGNDAVDPWLRLRVAGSGVTRTKSLGVLKSHEPNYDQLLVGAARCGGAWWPDLRPNRSFLRLLRNGIVYRPRGKAAAPRDLGD